MMVSVPSLRVVLTCHLPVASGSGEGTGVCPGEREGGEGAASKGAGAEQDQPAGGEDLSQCQHHSRTHTAEDIGEVKL